MNRIQIALTVTLFAVQASAQTAASLTSEQKDWLLAASGILAQRNGDRHDLLAGRDRTPDNILYGARLLKGSWGVRNRSDLLATLSSLRQDGHRADFSRLGRIASAPGGVPPGPDSGDLRRIEIAKTYYPRFGVKGILAWDYMRYISLCRWGYLAGYFSEQDGWEQILPAARRLQQTFSSWQEMGWDFIIGREYWSPGDDRKAETEYAFFQLLTDAQSPWRRLPWNLNLGASLPPATVRESAASLTVLARPRGLTCVLLDVIDRPRVGSLVPAMEQALGCKLRVLSEQAHGSDWRLAADCYRAAPWPQREVESGIRLEPLAAALRKQDVSLMFVFTSHSAVGQSLIAPPVDNHWIRDGYMYYEQTYDLRDVLPSPVVRYGFPREQVARQCRWAFGFLAAILIAAWLRRNRALRSNQPPDSRWTRFGQMEASSTALVWFAWPLFVVGGDGMAILRLAVGGEEFLGTVAAAAVALIPSLIVQAASAALVAPVYWQLRGVEATRGQIVRAAIWQSAAWAPAVWHTLLLADPQHTLDVGTLVVLFALVQFLEFVLSRKAMSAAGAAGARITSGPLKDRIMELAAMMKAKVRRVYLIPDSPWKWREAYSVGDGSLAIPAITLQELNRREVDAMIQRRIAWLHSGNDRKLVMAHMVGMVAVFLLGYWFRWILGPYGTVLLVRSGAIVARQNLAGSARRMEEQADREVVKTMGDPEALIAALGKLQRMKLQTRDKRFIRHIQNIATKAGLDEAKVAALLQQTSESSDRYPTPELSPGELTVVA